MQLVVGELDAGPRVAIVEQHVEPGCRQLGVQGLSHLLHAGGLLHVDRDQRHVERRDRLRPDDAALVVVLFDGGRHDARHADAVTTHGHHHRLALFVEHGGIHRGAVLAAELEDVADLDAAGDAERALAGGARVARDDVAQVHDFALRQVAAPVHAGEMHVALVRAADEIAHLRRRSGRRKVCT